MLFRVMVPIAARIWTRIQICWILTNTFYILPGFALFPYFFLPRFEILILVHVFFFPNWRSKLNKCKTQNETKNYHTLQILMICSWSQVSPQLLPIYLSFIAKFIERIIYISYYHIFTYYAFLNLFQWDFSSLYSTIPAVARSDGPIFICIFFIFSAVI